MGLLEKGLVEIKWGDFGVANASALSDPSLLPRVQNYKRQVASRMLPLSQADIDRKIPDAEYLVSRKIDGEFTVLILKEGELFSMNPGGRIRIGLPWQKEAGQWLAKAGITEAMIAGELYVTNEEKRRPRVHDVVSVVRQPKSNEDIDRIQFAVFDLISIDESPVDQTYPEVWTRIQSLFEGGQRVHPVETVALKGRTKIENQFRDWVETQGAEGLVVRSDSAGNFKIKPRHSLDALVIGFTESSGDRVGMLHDLLLGVTRQDGSIHVLTRVGGGFSDDDRRTLLSDLQDMVVDSEYAEVNSDHVAYQMVRPEWVVEISCIDIIGQNTRGGPINRMVLNWNRQEDRYEVVRRLPLVSVISPQFVRIRQDKSFNADDVRITQITDVVPVAKADLNASEITLAKSEVLDREVYTKQLRGETMVRKFIRWKTNKQQDNEEFPAFVVYYTDFSPARKVPLTREVRVTNSETQSVALYHEFKETFIKKGWSPYSPGDEDSAE